VTNTGRYSAHVTLSTVSFTLHIFPLGVCFVLWCGP